MIVFHLDQFKNEIRGLAKNIKLRYMLDLDLLLHTDGDAPAGTARSKERSVLSRSNVPLAQNHSADSRGTTLFGSGTHLNKKPKTQMHVTEHSIRFI